MNDFQRNESKVFFFHLPVEVDKEKMFWGSKRNSSILKPLIDPALVLIKMGAFDPFAYLPELNLKQFP